MEGSLDEGNSLLQTSAMTSVQLLLMSTLTALDNNNFVCRCCVLLPKPEGTHLLEMTFTS